MERKLMPSKHSGWFDETQSTHSNTVCLSILYSKVTFLCRTLAVGVFHQRTGCYPPVVGGTSVIGLAERGRACFPGNSISTYLTSLIFDNVILVAHEVQTCTLKNTNISAPDQHLILDCTQF
jgi:hypothetical protein